MKEARRKLLANLTGALVVGLLLGYDMSDRTGGLAFREFAANFLRAFAPYLFATLLAWKYAPRVFGRVVADYVYIPLVGSLLSLLLFYYSGAVFVPPQVEGALAPALVLFAFFSNFVCFGVLVMLAAKGVAVILGRWYR